MLVDGKEILVRTLGRLQTAEDVRRVVVRSNVDGEQQRVRDVARVVESFERETEFTRVNGTKSLSLNVFKKPSGDSLDIAAAVKARVEDYRRRHPGVSFSYSDDVTFFINRRLNVLLNNGAQGVALVLLCMFLYLTPVTALFTTLAIPFAFLGGLIVLHCLGYTINLLSLFAFILVSGMVVDDGIVISEFYEQKREEGLSPHSAAVVGISQMAIPVIASVLTTMVAFMPLAHVSGILGKFLRQFPVVVIAVLMVDLLECVFILPGHLALFADRIRFPRSFDRVQDWGRRSMDALLRAYTPGLRWCVFDLHRGRMS